MAEFITLQSHRQNLKHSQIGADFRNRVFVSPLLERMQVVEKDALIQEKEKLYVQLKNIIARRTTLHDVWRKCQSKLCCNKTISGEQRKTQTKLSSRHARHENSDLKAFFFLWWHSKPPDLVFPCLSGGNLVRRWQNSLLGAALGIICFISVLTGWTCRIKICGLQTRQVQSKLEGKDGSHETDGCWVGDVPQPGAATATVSPCRHCYLMGIVRFKTSKRRLTATTRPIHENDVLR